MAADDFQKVQPGQRIRIPARLHNAMIDAAAAHRDARGRTPPAPPLRNAVNPSVVLVKNGTEDPLPRFGVVGLESSLFAAAASLTEANQRTPVLVGRAPTADDFDRFAILLDRAGPGEVAPAVVAGVVQVQVDVIDGDHLYAAAVEDETGFLESSEDPTGAPILWKADAPDEETDLYWALVRVGNPVGLPVGQYQGMVYQVGANNVNVFDFTPAHPEV